ncbi:MAG: response regulator [Bryobacteraceae bacterium]|jgi:CheY-like chemotaxis protein
MEDHVYQLLLVEDSEAEAHFFMKVLRTWAVRHLLNVVKDGWEAMAYLHNHGYYAEAPRPDLIFLDLSLPKMDGFETLRKIRTDEDPLIACIPVIVLTNSSRPEDVRKAYQSGANCYLTKPSDLDSSYELMAAVEWFWFEVCKLPPPVLSQD